MATEHDVGSLRLEPRPAVCEGIEVRTAAIDVVLLVGDHRPVGDGIARDRFDRVSLKRRLRDEAVLIAGMGVAEAVDLEADEVLEAGVSA